MDRHTPSLTEINQGHYHSWHKADHPPCYRFSYQLQHTEKLRITVRRWQ